MGTKTNPGEFDCYGNAEPDEPMFILLARDPVASILTDLWADMREAAVAKGDDPEHIREARDVAQKMRDWIAANRPGKRLEIVKHRSYRKVEYETELKVWELDLGGDTEWIVHAGPTGAEVKAWYKQETGVDVDEESGHTCECEALPPGRVLRISQEEPGNPILEMTCAGWARNTGHPAMIASTVC